MNERPRLARVKVVRASRASQGSRAAAAAGAITLEIGALRIMVERGFDRATLAAVLEVLSGGRGAGA